ncbi:MAG TPA: hypothetical protein VIZ58_13315, partial [Thermoanaerobaculia bacterium]
LDRFIPLWDVRECHELVVAAPVGRAFQVLRNLDVNRAPIVKVLFWLRELPSRRKNRDRLPPLGRRSLLEDALSVGWTILEEIPGQQLAVGAITRPWEPVVCFRGVPGPELRAFRDPGFVKIVWGISVRPADGGGCILGTETRVIATDERSRRKFGRYWYVFGPFIRLIRRISLQQAKKELEGIEACRASAQ